MAIINIGMRLYFDKDLTFEKFNEIMSHRPNRICIPSEEGDKVKWLIEEYHFLDNGDCIITYKGEDTLSSTTEVCKATLHDVFPLWLYLGLEGAFIELPSEIGTETNHSILKACPKEQLHFIPQEGVVSTMHHQVLNYNPAPTSPFFDQSRKQNVFNSWNAPERVSVTEFLDRIEMVFIETSAISNFTKAPERRVFKVIFSCVDGKWNKSSRIYGTIQEAVGEKYTF